MASPGVDLLIGKVVSLLENEASLLANVRVELRELQSELESMRSFLLDAERRSQQTQQTESQRTCVSQVRDTALEIEEIIIEFNYHMNKQKASTKFNKFLYQASHWPNNLRVKHKIATKIQKIKKIISAIFDRRQRYGDPSDQGLPTQVADTNWLTNHNESSLFLKDYDHGGFEDEKEKLHGLLLSEDRQRMVISICGMGGSGKTTLAANAFNNQKIENHFKLCAWIIVSNNYGVEDILRAMIKEFLKPRMNEEKFKKLSEDLSNKSCRFLLEKLVNELQSQSYLLVLDDVWTTDIWRQINVALQNDGLDLCVSIQKMKLLHYLFVMVKDEEEFLEMDALSSPPPLLRTLMLVGKLEKVQPWFSSLQSLTCLYLHWAKLEDDLLPHIEELPNLGELILINASVKKQLHFHKGFLKLTHLHLSNFPHLHEIIIEKGAMPNIRNLILRAVKS